MTCRTGRKNQLIARPRASHSRDSSSFHYFEFCVILKATVPGTLKMPKVGKPCFHCVCITDCIASSKAFSIRFVLPLLKNFEQREQTHESSLNLVFCDVIIDERYEGIVYANRC